MASNLELMADRVRDHVIEKAIEDEEPRDDWQPTVSNQASYQVENYADQSACEAGFYIRVIEEYLDDENGSLSDYDAIAIVEEHFDEKNGIEAALKLAASTCVLNSVLDDLEKLGLQG